MKPRLDRPSRAPFPSIASRQPSATAAAERARRHRQRRRNGVRVLTVEIAEDDLQSLAKTSPQADPAAERAIRAVLAAAYGARPATGTLGEAPNGHSCAICGTPGSLWKGLVPCSYGGKVFNAHPRCFAVLRIRNPTRA